jgi:hypothetical protein
VEKTAYALVDLVVDSISCFVMYAARLGMEPVEKATDRNRIDSTFSGGEALASRTEERCCTRVFLATLEDIASDETLERNNVRPALSSSEEFVFSLVTVS